MVYRSWLLLLMLWFLVPGVSRSQVTSDELAEALFQERYLQGDGGAGTPTLGYLEEYDSPFNTQTGLSHHAGIDFRARTPEPVYSPVSGIVRYACNGVPGPTSLGALAIFVTDPSVGDYTVVFLHLSSCGVSVGATVRAGERVGLTGDVGSEGNPHLHIEVQRGDDHYPCGTGGVEDPGCPFNRTNPTPLNVIANNTHDPRAVIKSLIFARDLEDLLSPERIADQGLRFEGLNFGEAGRLTASVDVRHIEDYVNCAGSSVLEWEVPSTDTQSWTQTRIVDAIFPYEFSCGDSNFSLTPDSLEYPISFKVERSSGGETNSLAFPFKDVADSDEWYTPHILRVWARGIVEGYKIYYPRYGHEKSLNRFDPESSVTHGEALAMIFRAAGIEPPESNCICPGTDSLDWVYRYVCEAVNRGWVTCPLEAGDPANRGFVAAAIAGALEMPADQGFNGHFPDVLEDHPFARQISFCYDEGIVGGYPDGTFQPDAEINRAELAKILDEGFREDR